MTAADPDAGRGEVIDPDAGPDLEADAEVPCDAVPAVPAHGAVVAHRDARSAARTLQWTGMRAGSIGRQDEVAAFFIRRCAQRIVAGRGRNALISEQACL